MENEKQDAGIEGTKEKYEEKRGKSGWTEERRKAQAVRMSRVIESGKAHQPRKPLIEDEINYDAAQEKGVEEEVEETWEEEKEEKTMNPIILIILLLFAGIIVFVLWMKKKAKTVISGE